MAADKHFARSESVPSGRLSSERLGHVFHKKTFRKLTYCHHCTDMLWGIVNQGNICRICNFVTHDRCMSVVRTPCSSIAASLVKDPVAHTWSKPGKFRKEFCNVCRRRLEDGWAVRCEVCYYHVHEECHDLTVNDCRNCATYTSDQDEVPVLYHHWREGGVPPGWKCVMCSKDCGTNECLSSVHCSWCRRPAHSGCSDHVEQRCDLGLLMNLTLPPHCCSLPKIKLSADATHELHSDAEYGGGSVQTGNHTDSGLKGHNGFKVCDSSPQQPYKIVPVPHSASAEEILVAALRQFQISDIAANYCLVQVLDGTEKLLKPSDMPARLPPRSGASSPRLCIRAKSMDTDKGTIRVYPGMQSVDGALKFKTVHATVDTTSEEIIQLALTKMGLKHENVSAYSLVQVTLHKGVREHVLPRDAHPWRLMTAARVRSLREMKLTRFYLRRDAEVSRSTSVSLYVGDMPKDKPNEFYEQTVKDIIGTYDSDAHFGPAYPSFGCVFVEFSAPDTAARANAVLQQATLEQKQLKVISLPHVEPSTVPAHLHPLLVFVNKRSGGGYGEELCLAMKRLVNPHQVFSLQEGGPLPGLHVFRSTQKFRILMCGGDGTFGWILSVLDIARQNMACQNPPSALLPLGTGNDLARVLRWGSGYSPDESLFGYVMTVQNADLTALDRWTICIEENRLYHGDYQTIANRLKHVSGDAESLSDADDQPPCRRASVTERRQQFEEVTRGRSQTDQLWYPAADQDTAMLKRSSWTMSVCPARTTQAVKPADQISPVSSLSCEAVRNSVVEHAVTDEAMSSEDSKNKHTKPPSPEVSGAMSVTSRRPKIVVLNNYLGVGIDADITLGFHKAREGAPEKFNSRLHNKGVYVRLSMSKMVSRGNTGDLGKRLKLECDGKTVQLPDVEGIIVLNISSWGSGADLWGSDRDERFLFPAFNDGFIEVVGVNGIMHMAQIQGGLRSGIRLAQCSHVKLTISGPMPLQVDGEPWMQESDCTIAITRCSEQATMLMKSKKPGKKNTRSPSLARARGVKTLPSAGSYTKLV